MMFLLWSVPQASEGVPIRFFTMLPELVDAYYSPNMGLVTHLQYSVQREEEENEEPGATHSVHLYTGYNIKQDMYKHVWMCLCAAESNSLPPQLPPRKFPLNDVKDSDSKSPEPACKSLSDTYLMRLQHMDLSAYVNLRKNFIASCPQRDNSSCRVW